MIRRALHFAMAMVGAALWIGLWAGSALLCGLAVLGSKVWPGADRGNCWTLALPMLATRRGGLLITLDRLRIGPVPIPHAAWVDGAVEGVTETEPVERHRTARASWLGLRTLYFRFQVKRTERRPASRR